MHLARQIFLSAASVLAAAVVVAQDSPLDGSASAIRTVISGKICIGDDVLAFGESAQGAIGTFERLGAPLATYAVGYGTILIRRGEEVHGHVASVSPRNGLLYLSSSTYRCAN